LSVVNFAASSPEIFVIRLFVSHRFSSPGRIASGATPDHSSKLPSRSSSFMA